MFRGLKYTFMNILEICLCSNQQCNLKIFQSLKNPKASARKMKLMEMFNDGTFSFMLHHMLTLC